MLVLSRRVGEKIRIDEHVTIVVLSTAPGRVSIGIDAPAEVTILREEVLQKLLQTADKPVESSAAEARDLRAT